MGDRGDNSNVQTAVLGEPVLLYNEVVVDHSMNSRIVGEISPAETDGFGLVGDPSRGDQMKLWIAVRNGRIARIGFKSFGCPGAISTSSMLSALSERRTIRISLGRSTEEADVDATAKPLQATVGRLQAISSVGEATR